MSDLPHHRGGGVCPAKQQISACNLSADTTQLCAKVEEQMCLMMRVGKFTETGIRQLFLRPPIRSTSQGKVCLEGTYRFSPEMTIQDIGSSIFITVSPP